jgi:hypothetical protein
VKIRGTSVRRKPIVYSHSLLARQELLVIVEKSRDRDGPIDRFSEPAKSHAPPGPETSVSEALDGEDVGEIRC